VVLVVLQVVLLEQVELVETSFLFRVLLALLLVGLPGALA